MKSTLRFRREAPSVAQLYRDAMPTLTSVDNWARLYGIDAPSA